jgi:hypothetical protein
LNGRFRKSIEIRKGELAGRAIRLKKYQERAFSRLNYQIRECDLTLFDHW